MNNNYDLLPGELAMKYPRVNVVNVEKIGDTVVRVGTAYGIETWTVSKDSGAWTYVVIPEEFEGNTLEQITDKLWARFELHARATGQNTLGFTTYLTQTLGYTSESAEALWTLR
jgi:hypothetical protein